MQWISVKDQLPELCEDVLVTITGDCDPCIIVSHYDYKDDEPDEDGHLRVDWYYEGQKMYSTSWYQQVTHWMPLPPLPNIPE